VYVWADGICLQAGSKMARRIGAISGSEAARAQCVAGPSIADRALGFWKAAGEIRPTMRDSAGGCTSRERLAKLPKSQQPKAKRTRRFGWPRRRLTRGCVRRIHRELPDQIQEAVESQQGLRCAGELASHESHRKHVRNRALGSVRLKGCLSNRLALAMVFKLIEAAQKSWRRLGGHNQLPKLILGAKFAEGWRSPISRTCQPTTTAT
jgi:putative transposase